MITYLKINVRMLLLSDLFIQYALRLLHSNCFLSSSLKLLFLIRSFSVFLDRSFRIASGLGSMLALEPWDLDIRSLEKTRDLLL